MEIKKIILTLVLCLVSILAFCNLSLNEKKSEHGKVHSDDAIGAQAFIMAEEKCANMDGLQSIKAKFDTIIIVKNCKIEKTINYIVAKCKDQSTVEFNYITETDCKIKK